MRFNLSSKQEASQALEWLKTSTVRGITVDVKRWSPKRSLKANAYLHLLLQICGSEWGFSLAEMKTLYKRDIASNIYVYYKQDMPFIKSSAELDNKQMSDSIEQLKKYAGEQDLVLPEPNDTEALTYWDNQIEKNSKYL